MKLISYVKITAGIRKRNYFFVGGREELDKEEKEESKALHR